MFSKALVSIYFGENKISVIETDSSRKKIRKSGVIDVPETVVSGNKVLNPSALSQLLLSVWKKYSFSEKSVGVVIPEFSAFSKILTLPHLSATEYKEAVIWQAQDYLPGGLENSIIDWKLVEKNDERTDVLLVAVDKDLLLSYVHSTRLAGLFPYAVQTPSVSINNITKDVDGGALLVYVGVRDVLLVASEKEKIFGTSVLESPENDEIIQTAEKMVRHFKNLNLKKVFIGGRIGEDLFGKLQRALKAEFQILDPKVQGMTKDKIQDYLIPIAMQSQNIGEPEDPKSLNLLPANLVNKYKTQKARLQVWSLTLTTTLFIWISFLAVMASYFLISQQISSVKAKNSEKAQVAKERSRLQAEAAKINEVSGKVIRIRSSYVLPQEILNIISSAKPQGVQIVNYKINFERGEVAITGISRNRSSLVDFQKNLTGKDKVTEVDIPISSFENETNLEFSLSFKYGAVSKTQPAGAGSAPLLTP